MAKENMDYDTHDDEREDRSRSWSEYRRLIFYKLETLKSDHEGLERKITEDNREYNLQLEAIRENHNTLLRTVNEQGFKLNLWQALIASIPGWIALGFAIWKK